MKKDILYLIEVCVRYAIENELCYKADEPLVRNRLLDLFKQSAPYEGEVNKEDIPELLADVLEAMTDYAYEHNLIESNSPIDREIFDNKIGAAMLMPPSQLQIKYSRIYSSQGSKAATDWFYNLCRKSNYIRTKEIARNISYTAPSKYGTVEVTINLTKPEKDPKEIARQLSAPQVNYPKCQLCVDNVGYAGRLNHPPRQLLRTIPITLNDEPWHFQYSPYVYFNEHCIALSDAHIPMEINRATYQRLVDFLFLFPHYFIGSNAGLPIAGGSILSHLHFQGGNYTLPMMVAKNKRVFETTMEGVAISQINWPMPCIRLTGHASEPLIDYAAAITKAWEQYSDPDLGILAYTDSTPHNTITPILRFNEGHVFQLDLVLRNNRTNDDFPMGIFHPHPKRHHIKKENIGLIEVMGMFILPGRLHSELEHLARYLSKQDYDPEKIRLHQEWADSFGQKYSSLEEAKAAIRENLAVLCMDLLSDAAVYKDNAEGDQGLYRFLMSSGLIKGEIHE